MAMDFEVGSLANLISGTKSSSSPKKKKQFRIIPSEKKLVTFKTVKQSKTPKWEIEEIKEEKPNRVVESGYSGSNMTDQNKCKKRKNRTESLGDVTDQDRHEKKKKRKDRTEPLGDATDQDRQEKKKKRKDRTEFLNDVSPKKHHEKENKTDGDLTNGKERQIFVGNVPTDITKKKLIELFSKYGKVESVRLRGAPLSDPRIPKKVAVIKKQFHPDRNSMHAYVVFKKVDSAKDATAANGMLFEDHHLRVDSSLKQSQHDKRKAVFVGNIPFAAEDDDLWKIFESCGAISSLRIIRDQRTGVGKGFAFINFESADAVELALQLDGKLMNDRQLRVSRCENNPQKHRRNYKKKAEVLSDNPKKKKKLHYKIKEENTEKALWKIKRKNTDESDGTNFGKKLKESSNAKIPFQGQKVAENGRKKKKRKNLNKEELKKKVMIEKISSSKPSMKKMKKPVLKIKSAAKKIKLKPS